MRQNTQLRRGASLSEYALIISLIIASVIGSIFILGKTIECTIDYTSNSLGLATTSGFIQSQDCPSSVIPPPVPPDGKSAYVLTITQCVDSDLEMHIKVNNLWFTGMQKFRDDCPSNATDITLTKDGVTILSDSSFTPFPDGIQFDSAVYTYAMPLMPTSDTTINFSVSPSTPNSNDGNYTNQATFTQPGTSTNDFENITSIHDDNGGAHMYTMIYAYRQ